MANKKKIDSKQKRLQPRKKMGVINYPVGDFLIRIKNSALADRKQLSLKSTSQIKAVAAALVEEGVLEKYSEEDNVLTAALAYRKKEPVLLGLSLVSKPGLRIYMSVRDLEKRRKPSFLLLSTPLGILSSKKAVKNRVGGEVIAEIL